jgi:16S rRNA G966 N2-methylase RsmD
VVLQRRFLEGQSMNLLYYGDNLPILRDHVATSSVDLIYLDPPFNSHATYNALLASSLRRATRRAELGRQTA